MSASPENMNTAELAHEEKAALAAELFAPGVGAQAGPPTTPAEGTGTGVPAGAHSHGGPTDKSGMHTGSPAERFTSTDVCGRPHEVMTEVRRALR